MNRLLDFVAAQVHRLADQSRPQVHMRDFNCEERIQIRHRHDGLGCEKRITIWDFR